MKKLLYKEILIYEIMNDMNDTNDIKGVSILMPLYNGIEFLEESVNSVINQTYKNWEIIIGVNGYPEKSEVELKASDIINNLNTNNIFSIRVIYYKTRGKSQTLNMMVKDVIYDYIAILDVDDKWMPYKLELQMPFLKDFDVVGTNCQYFGEREDFPLIPFNDLSEYNIFIGNPIINSSVIINLKDAYWDENTDGVEDYDLWFRLYYYKRSFYNLSNILCLHRIHKASAFNNTNYKDDNDLRKKWFNIIYLKNAI